MATYMPYRYPRLSDADCNEVNVLMLVKGNERYVFMFDEQHTADILRTLGEFAGNPDLDFSWYDCAILCKRIREDK